MNVLDMLLNIDSNKIKNPAKEMEITRLSELTGQKVVFKLEGVDMAKYAQIAEQSKEVADIRLFTVLEGVREPNLKSNELCEKYNAITPKEVLVKLLLPGEINTLYEGISELSGFNKDAVVEVKNS
nr:XkdN-like protein [Sedimentibacter sp.]